MSYAYVVAQKMYVSTHQSSYVKHVSSSEIISISRIHAPCQLRPEVVTPIRSMGYGVD